MADEFDLWELIAAPIKALNEAEAAAAARFVELFLDYAVEDGAAAAPDRATPAAPGAAGAVAESSQSPRLRELSFEMQRVDPDGQMRVHKLTVPLMQLFPFGGVSIEQATLKYGMMLSANRQPDQSARAVQAPAPASRFSGRLAQTRGARDSTGSPSDANLEIEVKLRQMDIPQGLLDMIQHTQGVVRSEGPAVSPPPVSDARLFQVEVLGISRDLRQRTPRVNVSLRVTPRPDLGNALALQFVEAPARAFRLAVSKGAATITTATPFEIALTGFNKEKLAMLAAGKLGITIAGTSTDARSGARLDHNVLVMLAPQQIGVAQR